jgi:hypothetical protein
MTSTIDQTTSGQFVHVTGEFEPRSDEMRRDRALFYATALSIFSAKIVRSFIAHCQKSSPNGAPAIADQTQSEAIKELACVLLLLALTEQREKQASWLNQFFDLTWNHTDKLFPQPQSRAILHSSKDFEPNLLSQITSMNLCHKLGLGSTSEDAAIYIDQLLENSQRFRGELLVFALAAPLDELDKYIQAAA